MVLATTIQSNGSLHEVNIPAKCQDVLEWLRSKVKQPCLQYQGKIKEKDTWVSIFAESGSDSDDLINQHVLGGNFQEEIFVGTIAVLLTKSSNEDNYDKPASAYLPLKPTEYETMYSNWTFEEEDEDDDEELGEEEEEEEEEPEEEPEEKVEEEEKPVKKARVKAAVIPQDINTDTPQRQLIRKRYGELGIPEELSDQLEKALLQRSIRECTEFEIEIGWSSPLFCNHYRGRCIHLYENMKQGGYVGNPTNWKEKLVQKEVSAVQLAEMSPMELHAGRWKEQVEKQIEKDKHLYSNKGSASIFLYCSVCKKKSQCDYYQMQTRSADEPMTTFVTCLECDKRWKF